MIGATMRATTRTTAGLIHQTFLLVKLLLACGKNEIISAIAAFEGLVNETQTRDLLGDMMVFLRVHILAESPAVLSPLAARDYIFWTSTVHETEIGYRWKAYTIL